MASKYPTNVDNFNKSILSDTERILSLQSNIECDGVVISQYSLSFISTELSCDSLYPLYDEDLFNQEVVVAISQTLGELGDELVDVMDIMSDKDLYRDKHDYHVSKLSEEECTFKALGEPKGVVLESFSTPFIFSIGLAVTAMIIGIVWKVRRGLKPVKRDVDDVTRTNYNDEGVMNRDINNDEHVISQIIQDKDCVIKELTKDNELLRKQITEHIEKTRQMEDKLESLSHTIDFGVNNNNHEIRTNNVTSSEQKRYFPYFSEVIESDKSLGSVHTI